MKRVDDRSCCTRARGGLWIVVFALVSGETGIASAQPAVRSAEDALGKIGIPQNLPKPRKPPPVGTDVVIRWNTIAIDASGFDHTPVSPGETRTFGEQLGPARASRAMAIVHVAMFEAVNAIQPKFTSYLNLPPVDRAKKVSAQAALAQAAHDTLVAMFPSQKPTFDGALAEELAAIKKADERERGVALGASAAKAILDRRRNDGSNHSEPRIGIEYFPGTQPGEWRQDPISQIPIALGAFWDQVTPFVMSSATQFRAPAPPALTSSEYAAAYDEVKRLGGDGLPGGTPTERTADQSFVGVFWAYDGTPSLCAPPRLYNQVTLAIAAVRGTQGLALARLLALINVAMADAAIAIWESKFFYDLWRPITGIRESDPGTGPSGLGDGNPNTIGDPNFVPLGAPASNLNGPDFTPPFPAYPSGHAGFGGALFQTLRAFYGTDAIPFTFVSDEWNGVTRDSDGTVRPRIPRSFATLSAAEEENGQSRIYLGIHWSFDKTRGIEQGRRVADYVFARTYRPIVTCAMPDCQTSIVDVLRASP